MALSASFGPESSVSVSSLSTSPRSESIVAAQLGIDILAFFRQFEVGGNVIAAAAKIGICRQQMLQTLFLAHHLLGSLRIRPQIRVGGLLFNFG